MSCGPGRGRPRQHPPGRAWQGGRERGSGDQAAGRAPSGRAAEGDGARPRTALENIVHYDNFLGVNRDQAAAFQHTAKIPEAEFDSRLTAANQSGRVSRAAVLRDEDAKEEQQRARVEFDAVAASITPPDYDPTFDYKAIDVAGHLYGACEELARAGSPAAGRGVR